MDNRAARRKAAAAARRSKDRATQTSGTRQGAPSGAGVTDRPTNGAPGSAEAVEPEALVVTHSFDSGKGGGPSYSATIRLSGRRAGSYPIPGPRDTFVHEETVDGIVPGSGPVSVTSWVYGLEPGDWTVGAELFRTFGGAGARHPQAERLDPVKWSWAHWSLVPASPAPLHTRWAMLAPLARIPAVIPGSFTVLGLLSFVVALVTQSVLLARAEIPVGQSLMVSVIALVMGLVGAKLWYAFLHPGPWRQAILGGWAVDGFLVAAPVVAVALLLTLKLPVGRYFDATAPGIFFAVAVGRLGCFLTGCCAGRCTGSGLGVWSSDRRIGARRIPTQLLESAAGLVIGTIAWLLAGSGVLSLDGAVFVAAVGAYFLVRQMLLRLRAERRDFLWRRSRLVSGGSA